jgi:hydroxyacylglutathione hydrolase
MEAIRPPRVRRLAGQAFDCNVHLLDGDRPVVVDAGTGGATEWYVRKLKEILRGRRVERIVLTHRHYDHSGGAAGMSRELDAPVYIHEAGVAAMRGGDGEDSGAWMFGGELEPVEARPLREGDVIDVGGALYEVLHTPGHSPDAIALWDREALVLVPGDTVYADGGIGRWDLAGGDHGQLVRSLERLSRLGAESMYPAHGPAVEAGATEHILRGLRMARMYGGIGGEEI